MLKVAVIGVGSMGSNHVRVLSQIADLKAVCDLNEEVGKSVAKEYGCKYYKSPKDLLEKENLDAVSIVVPTKDHLAVAKFVLEQGVNVFLEKPIATNVKEASKLIEVASKSDKKFMIGHIERFNPAVLELKKIIENQELGRIISLSARRVGISPPKTRGSSVITDLAIHDVDIFNFLLNRLPSKSACLYGSALNNGAAQDYAEILLRYGVANASIQVNWLTPLKIRKLHVTGELGYADLDYIKQELTIFRNNYSRDYDESGEVVIRFGNPTKVDVKVEKMEPLMLELQHFLNCVEHNKEPSVSARDALNALSILENLNILND